MFKEKTLFIVGAGASCEIGLPIGATLKEHIVRLLDFEVEYGQLIRCDRHIIASIEEHVRSKGHHDINAHLQASRHICAALTQASSIDNFLFTHQDNEELVLCGKLAIVKSILEAEKNSNLYIHPMKESQNELPDLKGTWYPEFFRILVDGVRKTEVDTIFNNASFIVFNYDRCIEHYLVKGLLNYYAIPEREAARLVNKATILHPYGTVGRLSWQAGTSVPVNYGASDTLPLKIASQIKTFSERIEDEAAIDLIRSEVRSAQRVVFLGFSFHPQNMEILSPNGRTKAEKVFSTTYGISGSDRTVIAEQIGQLFDNEDHLTKIEIPNNIKCFELFGEFWRSLS